MPANAPRPLVLSVLSLILFACGRGPSAPTPTPTAPSQGLTVRYFTQEHPAHTLDLHNQARPALEGGDLDRLPLGSDEHLRARWAGYLRPPTTGTYTFFPSADGSVRLSINHQAVQSGTALTLEGGKAYWLQMAFTQTGPGRSLSLEWSGPQLARQPIPATVLSPNTRSPGGALQQQSDPILNQNLLPNPDFENGSTSWTWDGTDGLTASPGHNGSAAAGLVPTLGGSPEEFFSQSLSPSLPGARYAFDGWLRADDAAQCKISVFLGDVNAPALEFTKTFASASDWVEVTGEAVYPPKNDWVVVDLRNSSFDQDPGAGPGACLFDDLSLKMIAPSPAVPDPADDLLSNSGFDRANAQDSGLGSWQTTKGSPVVSAPGRDGTGTAFGSAPGGAVRQVIPATALQPNTQYVVKAWSKGDRSACLLSWVADGSDFVQPPDTTAWQQTGFVLTTPATPQDIPITLGNLSSSQNPKSCFFDDVRFGPLVGDAEPVQADIDPDITAPTQFAGEEASFSAGSSSGDDLSFHWDFGDGASADGSDTTHQYTTPGRYTVTLTVQDASGTTSSTTTSVAVMPSIHDIPDSRVTVLGTPTTFDVRYPVPGLTYNWDFGDGQTATGARVQHAYTARGFQDVHLTIYDDRASPSPDGSHPIVTQQDTRVNNIVPLPSAWIDGASTGGNGVYLSAEQSQGATALTYQWDFGDGSSGSGPTVQHTYVDNGRYPITLTATDTYGQTGVAHQVLLIGTTADVVNNAVTVNLGDGSSAARGALRAQGVRASDPQVQAALDRAHKRAQKGVLILKGRTANTSGRLRSQALTTIENAFPFALPVRPADITDTFTADGFGSSISEASASAAWNGTTRARGNGWDLTACSNGQCASAVLSRDFFPPALPDGVSRQSFTFKTSASSPDTQTLVTNMAAYSGLRVPHVLLSIVPDTQLADITEHEYSATIDGREQYLLQVNVPESGITQDGFIGFNVPLYAVDASGQVAENVSGAFNAQFLGQNVYSASAEGVMVRGRADMIVYVPIAAFSDGGTQFDLTQVLVTSDPNCNEDDNYAAVGLVLQGCQTIQATHDVPQFGQASGLRAQSLGAQAQHPAILPFSFVVAGLDRLVNQIILGATVDQRLKIDAKLADYQGSIASSAIGVTPIVGDGSDLLIQAYYYWEGHQTDPVVATLATAGLVLDLKGAGTAGESLTIAKKAYQLSKQYASTVSEVIAAEVRKTVLGNVKFSELADFVKTRFAAFPIMARVGSGCGSLALECLKAYDVAADDIRHSLSLDANAALDQLDAGVKAADENGIFAKSFLDSMEKTAPDFDAEVNTSYVLTWLCSAPSPAVTPLKAQSLHPLASSPARACAAANLAASMLKKGVIPTAWKRGKGLTPHHIIPFGATAATWSRCIHKTLGIDVCLALQQKLKKLRIDINDGSNGVLLPTSSKSKASNPSLPGSIHSKIHTQVYFTRLYDDLVAATTAKEMRRRLQLVAQELLAETYPF